MYGKYRRMMAQWKVKIANSEKATIVLSREFAKALKNTGLQGPEFAPFLSTVREYDLDLRTADSEWDEAEKEIDDVKPYSDGPADRALNSVITGVFRMLARYGRMEDKGKLMVKVPRDSLEGFLDDLSKPEIAPMISKVYYGDIRVL